MILLYLPIFLLAVAVAATVAASTAIGAGPEPLKFPSHDGTTELAGYVWMPTGQAPFPAVVMLHGRAGVYSSAARGVYDVSTLSQRHAHWGEFWAARGYMALLVDSFGPRGYPQGFAIHSYGNRPAAVSDQTVRPLDAYSALEYLRGRGDVSTDRIGVFGWSNGAMTILAALVRIPAGMHGFRAAVAPYPGCGAQAGIDYRPYAPLLMLLAGDDREVSPLVCRRVAEKARSHGLDIEAVLYADAQHAFDDPARSRQANAANQAATEDTHRRAERFFAGHLQASAGSR